MAARIVARSGDDALPGVGAQPTLDTVRRRRARLIQVALANN
jgi:hypothetical protein